MSEATSGAYLAASDPHIAALMRATICRSPRYLPTGLKYRKSGGLWSLRVGIR
jgi:hypothetical protein